MGLAGPALAHATLVSATPAKDAMAMPPPKEIRLKFSEPVEPKFTKVTVMGPGKKAIKTGTVAVDPNDKTQLIVPLQSPLPDGNYNVDWQAVSTDGHKVRGSYRFESMQ
jgi:methionine-rich copper-binding protein CopC